MACSSLSLNMYNSWPQYNSSLLTLLSDRHDRSQMASNNPIFDLRNLKDEFEYLIKGDVPMSKNFLRYLSVQNINASQNETPVSVHLLVFSVCNVDSKC